MNDCLLRISTSCHFIVWSLCRQIGLGYSPIMVKNIKSIVWSLCKQTDRPWLLTDNGQERKEDAGGGCDAVGRHCCRRWTLKTNWPCESIDRLLLPSLTYTDDLLTAYSLCRSLAGSHGYLSSEVSSDTWSVVTTHPSGDSTSRHILW